MSTLKRAFTSGLLRLLQYVLDSLECHRHRFEIGARSNLLYRIRTIQRFGRIVAANAGNGVDLVIGKSALTQNEAQPVFIELLELRREFIARRLRHGKRHFVIQQHLDHALHVATQSQADLPIPSESARRKSNPERYRVCRQ